MKKEKAETQREKEYLGAFIPCDIKRKLEARALREDASVSKVVARILARELATEPAN